jgi:hypothetical protein
MGYLLYNVRKVLPLSRLVLTVPFYSDVYGNAQFWAPDVLFTCNVDARCLEKRSSRYRTAVRNVPGERQARSRTTRAVETRR